MPERRSEKSVGEAADIIATAQRIIEAGVNSGDSELIEVGRKRWKEVWPDEVVDLFVDIYVKDLQEELANQNL
jgi:hypothetical protein